MIRLTKTNFRQLSTKSHQCNTSRMKKGHHHLQK